MLKFSISSIWGYLSRLLSFSTGKLEHLSRKSDIEERQMEDVWLKMQSLLTQEFLIF